MPSLNDPTPQMVNQQLLNLLDGDSSMVKRAADSVNDFVRLKMREDGFFRKILPPVQLTNDQLDRQVDTDKPVKIVDMEPDSPAAVSIPFASLPNNRYIRGKRFRVMFDRIVTPRFTKDVDELRTYDMDIRQVISDNAIKDMLAEEDGKFIAAVNSLLGTAGTTIAETAESGMSAVALHRNVSGGITRDTLVEAKKVLPSTSSHLEPATVLCNNVTIKEIEKWGRDEMGGDLSQDIAKNGYAETNFLNMKWIVTIKRNLIPDNTIYMFADPKWLGVSYILEDTTMYIDRKAYMLEFFAYETLGACIANVNAVARVNFT